jgi:hypothetical protein
VKRVNVTIPTELLVEARSKLPDLNVSALVQHALRSALRCPHPALICAHCGLHVDLAIAARDRLDALYTDLMEALEDLLWSGGSIEGAARVVKNVGLRHGIPRAATRPLPRLTRARREEDRDAARHRHPTSQEVTDAAESCSPAA